MKPQTVISLIAAAVLALTSVSAAAQGQHGQRSGAQSQDRAKVERGQRDFDRDRMRDRDRAMDSAKDRSRDQVRKQDRIHQTEDGNGIYGGEFMSEQERKQYREQLRLTESDPQARTEFLAQHRVKMQKRAKDQGKHLDDPPNDRG